MCERYSWYEREVAGQKVCVFVTAKDIYHTQRGRETQEHCNNDPTEFWGHSAIAFFYGATPPGERDIQRDCTTFESPDNFPPELVAAIKRGDMAEFGVNEEMKAGLLSLRGRKNLTKQYESDAEYKKATAEYKKATAKRKEAAAKWEEACAKWREAHIQYKEAYAKRKEATAKWEEAYAKRKEAAAKWEEANAKWEEANAKWDEANAKCFWRVFAEKTNRPKVWR
jgi:hypothetical protein